MEEECLDSTQNSVSLIYVPSRQECANQFEENVTETIAELKVNKHLYHFSVDRRVNKACFSLTFNDSSVYTCLKDLTPVLFTGMMEVLLHFQHNQRVSTTRDGEKASILRYHFGWKNIQSFRLNILPNSLEEFRSTILYYIADEQVADTLMSAPKMHTEYGLFESKLKFIVENREQKDAFHVFDYANNNSKCQFYISRRTHSVVAVNYIDMIGCEHPYYEAYHYARMLETFFADAVGGVSIGVDHSGKTVWVWADCDEKQFEAKVLSSNQVTKTGEFAVTKQLEPKPEGCKAVHVGNLDYDIGERELKVFFRECGKIDRIDVPKDKRTGKNKGFAFVHFKNTEAADKAMELDNKFLSGRKVQLIVFTEKTKGTDDKLSLKNKMTEVE